MRKSNFQNMTPEQAVAAQRGYSTKAAKLPELKRGSYTVSTGWWDGIKETAGEHGEDTALLKASLAHRGLVDSWDALERIRQNRSPNATPAKHLQDVARAAQQLLDTQAKRIDSARADIQHRKAAIQSEIKQRMGLDTSNPQTQEIRSILRGMDEKARSEAISKAVADGDQTIISAIWDAHPVTVGLTGKHLDAIKQQAISTHATDLQSLTTALDKADSVLLSAFDESLLLADSAAGGTEAARKFAADAEAADLATAGFMAALNN